MKLLHIIATPRGRDSNTLRISAEFLETLELRFADLEVEELELFKLTIPDVTGDNIESKYALMMGSPLDGSHAESWRQIEMLIERFLSADFYLISTPMWNFGIPYILKFYIDAIVQPGYLFRYNELGYPVGLATGKKMACVTTRGGDYSPDSPLHVYDFTEPYLRSIFSYVGITDIRFIHGQPMDISLEKRQVAMDAAMKEARMQAIDCDWAPDESAPEVIHPEGLKPSVLVEKTAAPQPNGEVI